MTKQEALKRLGLKKVPEHSYVGWYDKYGNHTAHQDGCCERCEYNALIGEKDYYGRRS